ncbi:hypothetical protein GQ54DRAFT_295377 [Martensiomyces pterosporus]|nr:hypothetical protein GQ54DRAFT_295377 [Martensiomyces pterosporus]
MATPGAAHQCQRQTWEAYYASEDVAKRFDGIIDSLVTEVEITASTTPTAATVPKITGQLLSQTTHNIQIAQEAVYGKGSGSKGVKLPAALFGVPEDGVKEQSALYNILSAALEHATLHGVDLDSAQWAHEGGEAAKEVLEAVRLKLGDNRQLPLVKVFFVADMQADRREKLGEQLKALGGRAVESEVEATHVVEDTEVRGSIGGQGADKARDDVWFRTLNKHDSRVLVHWWYTPDSYDAWVAAEPPYSAEPEEAPEHSGAWRVSRQWIEDSVGFNEWLNEEDYESAGPHGSPGADGSAAGVKRRAHASLVGDEKRLRVDGDNSNPPEGVEIHDVQENQPGPGNRKRNEFEPLPNGELANVPSEDAGEEGEKTADKDGAEADAGGNAAENKDSMDVDKEKGERTPAQPNSTDEQLQREEDARRLLVEQTQEIIVPSYSAWFCLSSIHENERRGLPEFFNSRNLSKTPTIYKEYRNFMINSYRLNPSEYLTVTACRRNLAGDVCAIMRVHAFLEQWGLINYQADADSRPSTIGPPFTGHFRISADTPRGLVPFQPSLSAVQLTEGNKSAASPKAAAAAGASTPAGGSAAGTPGANGLALRKSIYESPTIGSEANKPAREVNASEPPATTKDVFCYTCGVNCTAAYYHCIKNLRQRVDLCAPCYLDGRFPGTLSSSDFVKLTDSTAGQPGSGDDWTDQETLLLLEGIEMYDDDWNRIAEHVGTRSREECVLHFLKLPIEDPYEVAPLKDSKGAQAAVTPFSRADNPVMSVVAFLASNVNPGVAAAAAKAALAELTKNASAADDSKQEKSASPNEIAASAAVAAEAEAEAEAEVKETPASANAGDSMDVDAEGAESAPAAADKPTQSGSEKASSPEPEKQGNTAGAADEPSSLTAAIADARKEVPPNSEMAYASAVALGAASAKASKLAEYEERQLESMVHRAVELQMSKLELKMRQFEEMEAAIEQERKDLARQRQQLVEECWALKKKMALFESGAAGRIAAANSSNLLQANDNTAQIARPPTAPPKPAAAAPPAPATTAPAATTAAPIQSPAPAAPAASIPASIPASAPAPATAPPATPSLPTAPAAAATPTTTPLPDVKGSTDAAGAASAFKPESDDAQSSAGPAEGTQPKEAAAAPSSAPETAPAVTAADAAPLSTPAPASSASTPAIASSTPAATASSAAATPVTAVSATPEAPEPSAPAPDQPAASTTQAAQPASSGGESMDIDEEPSAQ